MSKVSVWVFGWHCWAFAPSRCLLAPESIVVGLAYLLSSSLLLFACSLRFVSYCAKRPFGLSLSPPPSQCKGRGKTELFCHFCLMVHASKHRHLLSPSNRFPWCCGQECTHRCSYSTTIQTQSHLDLACIDASRFGIH